MDITRRVLLRIINRVLEEPGCTVPHTAVELERADCPECNHVADLIAGELASDFGVMLVPASASAENEHLRQAIECCLFRRQPKNARL